MTEPYRRCVVDASVIIAALAREEGRVESSKAVLADAEAGEIELFVPMIGRVEVVRYGTEKPGDLDEESADKLTRFLDAPWFRWVEVDRELADLARDLVRTTRIRRGVDALYLATAQHVEAEVVFSWDRDLLDIEVPDLRISEPYGVTPPRLDLGD